MSATKRGDSLERYETLTRMECPEHGTDTGMPYTEGGILRCDNCSLALEGQGYVLLPAIDYRGAVGALERIADLDEEYGEETAAGEIALGALVDLGVRQSTEGQQG